MRDLFDTPPIAGLEIRNSLVSPAEQSALVDRSLALDLSPFRFQGWEGKRLTRSFGWHYDFDSGVLGEAEPIPAWLAAIRDRAAHAFGRDPAAFAQALVIRYDPGAGIGWHRDRPQFDEVIGVSLAGPATLAFSPPPRRWPLRASQAAARAALGLSAVGCGADRLAARHRRA